jgi:hypothetical protein
VAHVCSAFPAGPSSATGSSYEATIVNSMQATDRHAGRAAVFGRALQPHNEWCKAPSRFSALIGCGGRDGSVRLIFEAAAPMAEKVNSRDGLAVAGIGITVVFGRNLIILLAQLQLLLI